MTETEYKNHRLKKYKFKCKTVTPLFIDSGEEALSRWDYVRDSNNTMIVQQDKLVELFEILNININDSITQKVKDILNSPQEQEADWGLSALLGKNFSTKLTKEQKKSFFINLGIYPKNIKNLNTNVNSSTRNSSNKKNEEAPKNIKLFIGAKNDQPYIPGSSIKGMIISSLYHKLYTAKYGEANDKEYKEQLKTIKEKYSAFIKISDCYINSNDLKLMHLNTQSKNKNCEINLELAQVFDRGQDFEFILTIEQPVGSDLNFNIQTLKESLLEYHCKQLRHLRTHRSPIMQKFLSDFDKELEGDIFRFGYGAGKMSKSSLPYTLDDPNNSKKIIDSFKMVVDKNFSGLLGWCKLLDIEELSNDI